ncbi:MAG: restriction endonuclease subunit S [Alphaproteobacteria bacterium]|jgi:type I restriction enzyme S subunit
MSVAWPTVPLGEVVEHRKEFITIDDLKTYRRPRVKLHAQGIVLRDAVPGALIKTKKQQVARAGEFLVAEIDAKVGGFGLVPDDLDGAIVSSHYFLYGHRPTLLDNNYLGWFVRTRAFREQVEAQGSTNYAAIRPSDVLEYEIPLPPLGEQRRIVARIEELAAKVEEARGLRMNSALEIAATVTAARRALIGETPGENWVPLDTLVAEIENGKSPATEGRPAEPNEWAVLKVGAVSFGVFDERENKALPASFEPVRKYEVVVGDFLMSRANTSDLVGACAIVRSSRSKLMLSDKIFRFKFRPKANLVPEFLDHAMKSPALRTQIVAGASGTSPTMKNISKEKVRALLVPQMPVTEQRRIVAELDALQAKVDAVKALQTETAAELDAMLPAILDKAFKGEL